MPLWLVSDQSNRIFNLDLQHPTVLIFLHAVIVIDRDLAVVGDRNGPSAVLVLINIIDKMSTDRYRWVGLADSADHQETGLAKGVVKLIKEAFAALIFCG